MNSKYKNEIVKVCTRHKDTKKIIIGIDRGLHSNVEIPIEDIHPLEFSHEYFHAKIMSIYVKYGITIIIDRRDVVAVRGNNIDEYVYDGYKNEGATIRRRLDEIANDAGAGNPPV